MPFFQFTSANACKNFIKSNSNIVWSDFDSQEWNGDATMM